MLGIGSNPNIFELITEHSSDLSFVGHVFGHGLEKNSSRGDTRRVKGREQIGLPQVDVEDHLSSNKEDDKAEIDPGDYGDSIVTVAIIGVWVDVPKSDNIELLSGWIGLTSGIDRKEDRPSKETTNKGDDDGHLEVPQQEEGIKRVLLQNDGVGDAVESLEPTEHAPRQGWRALLFAQSTKVSSRSILAGKLCPEEEKGSKEAKGY